MCELVSDADKGRLFFGIFLFWRGNLRYQFQFSSFRMKNRGKNKKKQWRQILKNLGTELSQVAKEKELRYKS